MIKYCLIQWHNNEANLRKHLGTKEEMLNYKYVDLLKLVVKYVLNGEDGGVHDIPEYKYLPTHDVENITIIGDGKYQGCLLFMIPVKTYMPAEYEYLMTYVDYGSCTCCDLLLRIQYDPEHDEDQLIKDIMTLCRDMVTRMIMIKPYNTGRDSELFETVECTFAEEEYDDD